MADQVPIKLWAKVVARAWADEEFRKRLLLDTNAVLAENGFNVGNSQIRVIYGSDTWIFPLPPKPDALSDNPEDDYINAYSSSCTCC